MIKRIRLRWSAQRSTSRLLCAAILVSKVSVAVAAGATAGAPTPAPVDPAGTCDPGWPDVRADPCPVGADGVKILLRRNRCPGPQPGEWRVVADSCGVRDWRLTGGLCVDCIEFRVGPPRVVRGPFRDELDANFSVLPLSGGKFRGFSGGNQTFAIDADTPWAMKGARVPVAPRGHLGEGADCGNWLVHLARVRGTLYGLFHIEGSCNRQKRQTHKAMALATSSDEGLSWTPSGRILATEEAPREGAVTGLGDCTAVDAQDGYLYVYCLRARDWRTVVARAELSNLGPGGWWKWDGEDWSQPGLGGKGASLGFAGTSAGWWAAANAVILLGEDKWFGGLRMWISTDKHTFIAVSDPLINFDDHDWRRPARTSLQAYPGIVNEEVGGNAFSDRFILTYTYVPENLTFKDRYLVMHDVTLSPRREPVRPQVLRAISRWRVARSGQTLTTVAPVTGLFEFDKVLGYGMTRPLPGDASVEIVECQQGPQPSDSFIAGAIYCEQEGLRRLRSAGWLPRGVKSDSWEPLVLCRSANGDRYNSASDQCDGRGSNEGTIGYLIR